MTNPPAESPVYGGQSSARVRVHRGLATLRDRASGR